MPNELNIPNKLQRLSVKGKRFFVAPYKVYYAWADVDTVHVKVAFAVPKRIFAKAVQRNKLKRLSREAYRTQKQVLIQLATIKDQQLNIVFMYQSTKVLSQTKIANAIQIAIDKIVNLYG